MPTFYLSGQRTFGNRGCEAIVRSTVAVLRAKYSRATILVPSSDIGRDQAQWSAARESGVEFVPAYTSWLSRPWVHAQRLPLPFLKRAGWPFRHPKWLRQLIGRTDAVLSVGGDNYSLDYRLPSPLMGLDRLAMDQGKPVYLWGASVGPFEKEPHFVPAIRDHLSRMTRVMVRESVSCEYLKRTLGLDNVDQMVDPAFTLGPEAVDVASFWPRLNGHGVLGLNVSPLIERYKKADQDIKAEVVTFIRHIVREKGYGVVLVPHVIPLDGARKNNDAIYMAEILAQCGDLNGDVTMMPSYFNASQIKYVIGQLRFFIGARTHAAIAALSSGVPTISIAYSVKARGINRDLLQSEWMVLPTPDLSSGTLLSAVDNLEQQESEVKKKLRSAMPEYNQRVMRAMEIIGSAHG